MILSSKPKGREYSYRDIKIIKSSEAVELLYISQFDRFFVCSFKFDDAAEVGTKPGKGLKLSIGNLIPDKTLKIFCFFVHIAFLGFQNRLSAS